VTLPSTLLAVGIVLASLFPACTRSLAQSSSPSGFRITGVVISSRDGSVISHCRLSVRKVSDADPTSHAQVYPTADNLKADDRGHFSIKVPSAGRWQITATARAFRTQSYDQHDEFSSAIVLTAAIPTHDLVFKLDPDALLTGVVLDEAGEPVRRATVQIIADRSSTSVLQQPSGRGRLTSITDDRGRYEISGLAPGEYRIAVQAQPWYAIAAQATQRAGMNAASTGSPLDPSLDVVYPQTWFPGVDDFTAADVLSIHPGEVREADFNLHPLPSTHLRLGTPPPSPTAGSEQRLTPSVQMERLDPNGFNFVNASTLIGPDQQIEVGGLAPGFYRVATHSSLLQEEQVSFLHITGTSQGTIDMGAAAVEAARVHLQLQGVDEQSRIDVALVDASTGTAFRSGSTQRDFRHRQPEDASSGRMLQVPEGRYQVVLSGSVQDIFLRSVTVNGTVSPGRLITVHRADNTLLLRLASGRASVRGVATLNGIDSPGAMVLLVPTSFGDPSSVPLVRRDQTDTDGSFDLADVIPGQYILVAIDHGWNINWHDPSTLELYLLHGVPLTLDANDTIHQDAVAQLP